MQTRLSSALLVSAGFILASCVKSNRDAGSDAQFVPPEETRVQMNGHTSDCSMETMHYNQRTTLGYYELDLDRSWGQDVEIFLQDLNNPNSAVCYHPRRAIGGRVNTLQGVVVSVDGVNHVSDPNLVFQPQSQPLQPMVYVQSGGKRFLAYEREPGACSTGSSNSCVIWGLARSDKRVTLVNGSCLGGYRVAGVVPGADGRHLFNQGQVKDLRGFPVNNCFVLTKQEWANRPPQWSSDYDGPLNPHGITYVPPQGVAVPFGAGGPRAYTYPFTQSWTVQSGFDYNNLPPGVLPPVGFDPGPGGGASEAGMGAPPPGYGGVPPVGYQGAPPPGYGNVPPAGSGVPPPGYGNVPPAVGGVPPGYGVPPIGYDPPDAPHPGEYPPGGLPHGQPPPVGYFPPAPPPVVPGPGFLPGMPIPGGGFVPLPPLPILPPPTGRNFIADVAVDSLFTVGQYSLCRFASSDSIEFTGGIACRLGGILSYSPLFNECMRQCGDLYVDKQIQQGDLHWYPY